MKDSDIYRMTDAYRDRHPDLDPPGPDEDSLRGYFVGGLHADWPDRRCGWLAGFGGVAAAVLAGALLALYVVWAVTS